MLFKDIRQIAITAMFSALTVVGSFIKLPSPLPTVAFDSLPGFFSALYFGPIIGAFVLGVGHIATSVISGFPLGLLHIPIALGMAFDGVVIGFLNGKRRRFFFILAIVVGILINTVLVLLVVPFLGWGFVIFFTPFLLFASTVNMLVAAIIYKQVKRRIG